MILRILSISLIILVLIEMYDFRTIDSSTEHFEDEDFVPTGHPLRRVKRATKGNGKPPPGKPRSRLKNFFRRVVEKLADWVISDDFRADADEDQQRFEEFAGRRNTLEDSTATEMIERVTGMFNADKDDTVEDYYTGPSTKYYIRYHDGKTFHPYTTAKKTNTTDYYFGNYADVAKWPAIHLSLTTASTTRKPTPSVPPPPTSKQYKPSTRMTRYTLPSVSSSRVQKLTRSTLPATFTATAETTPEVTTSKTTTTTTKRISRPTIRITPTTLMTTTVTTEKPPKPTIRTTPTTLETTTVTTERTTRPTVRTTPTTLETTTVTTERTSRPTTRTIYTLPSRTTTVSTPRPTLQTSRTTSSAPSPKPVTTSTPYSELTTAFIDYGPTTRPFETTTEPYRVVSEDVDRVRDDYYLRKYFGRDIRKYTLTPGAPSETTPSTTFSVINIVPDITTRPYETTTESYRVVSEDIDRLRDDWYLKKYFGRDISNYTTPTDEADTANTVSSSERDFGRVTVPTETIATRTVTTTKPSVPTEAITTTTVTTTKRPVPTEAITTTTVPTTKRPVPTEAITTTTVATTERPRTTLSTTSEPSTEAINFVMVSRNATETTKPRPRIRPQYITTTIRTTPEVSLRTVTIRFTSPPTTTLTSTTTTTPSSTTVTKTTTKPILSTQPITPVNFIIVSSEKSSISPTTTTTITTKRTPPTATATQTTTRPTFTQSTTPVNFVIVSDRTTSTPSKATSIPTESTTSVNFVIVSSTNATKSSTRTETKLPTYSQGKESTPIFPAFIPLDGSFEFPDPMATTGKEESSPITTRMTTTSNEFATSTLGSRRSNFHELSNRTSNEPKEQAASFIKASRTSESSGRISSTVSGESSRYVRLGEYSHQYTGSNRKYSTSRAWFTPSSYAKTTV